MQREIDGITNRKLRKIYLIINSERNESASHADICEMNLMNREKSKYKGSMAGSSPMPSRSNKESSVVGRVTEEINRMKRGQGGNRNCSW